MIEKFKNLSISSFQNIIDFYINRYKSITLFCTIVFIGLFSLLGWFSNLEVRKVVIEDFNNQQLIIARYASNQISNNLNVIKREMSLLVFSPAIQYFESVQMYRRIGISFSSLKDYGILEIRLINKQKWHTYSMGYDGINVEYTSEEDREVINNTGNEKSKGIIAVSDVANIYYNGKETLIIKLTMPVWQISVDDAHPVATNKFVGSLVFVLDVRTFVSKVTGQLRSGKTGYAWTIDNRGIFLYHPDPDFIGKSAFEARQKKIPTISFSKINQIQKEMLLKGGEGTSSYISGWHRGDKNEVVEKLIAYAPVYLNEQGIRDNLHWTVAVVAPITEVEGAIRGIQTRQLLIQGLAIIVTVGACWLIVGILLRWSSTIKREVDEKTRELTRSEYQWRSLIEHANDIIYTISAEGIILSMNNFGFKFFNKGYHDVIGKDIYLLFPKDVADVQMQKIRDVIEKGKGAQLSCSIKENDYEYWLSINFSGLLDEWGNIYKVLAIARDITSRVKIEQQMSHTEKLASVGTLSAGIAHEINNPLAIILGFTDILIDKFPEGAEERYVLETIRKHGLNAKRIVENLLGFARYTEHIEKDFDINQNLESVLSVVSNNLAINKITLSTELQDNMPMVRGDSGELQQVFFNIISNAVSAMKGGGRLHIKTRTVEDDTKIEILISDTGDGIPKECRNKIFDPFFTTKKVGEGTGLGLSISYGIVSKHGGDITFETKTEDESNITGTTFIITIPTLKKTKEDSQDA